MCGCCKWDRGLFLASMGKIIATLVLLLGCVIAYVFLFEVENVPTSDVPEVAHEEIEENVGATHESPVEEDKEENVGDGSSFPLEEESSVLIEEEADEDESGWFQEQVGNIPSEFNLAVPFTSQAPHANWDLPYQEACEEASAYMAAEFFAGTPSGAIDADTADAAILDMVAFQETLFGYYLDTTAIETAQVIDLYFGLQSVLLEDPTPEQIKAQIAMGHPVIVPAAGRKLYNPFFSGDGPLYHMLVIKGYTEDTFITNDPGTYRGENYAYDIEVIMEAIGDWNGGDPENGEKVVIVVTD